MKKTKLQFRIIVLVLTIAALLFAAVPAVAQSEPTRVYFVGSETGSLHQALTLTDELAFVTDPAQADVFVVNGKTDDPQVIADAVKAGAGLVLFLSPEMTADEVSILLGEPVTLEEQTDALSLTTPEKSADVTATGIVWNSAPQVRGRMTVTGAALNQVVIGFEDKSLVLGSGKVGAGQVFLFTAYLDDASNPQIQDWAYYNYLIYHLTERAAGQTPQTFGDYPASPVPHSQARTFIFIMLGVLVVTVATIFTFVRRYSLSHPEELDSLVVDKNEFVNRQMKTDWENLGFHRPLSGFLLAFVFQLILAIPLTIYTTVILPVYILPSAQALGIWGRVTQIFAVIWMVFDFGTSTAFVKFFSQYRVHDPKKAVKYIQFYVWWQALTGAFQVAWVTALASGVLPHTSLALYAWVIILHSVIQIPGFLSVFRNVLSAWQRFDYTQILDLAVAMFFPMFTQSAIVLIMVAWGSTHPAFGSSMGGLLGMPLAAYLTEFLSFLLGWRLYRRLGYNTRIIFMAHFDKETVKSALGFGVFMMGGSAAYGLGQAIEIVITTIFLVNYNEIWGNWQLAQGLAASYAILLTLNGNLLPSVSEAISNARKVLSKYYVAMAYKWGGLISGFFCASLLAVADRFILGASGKDFERAALYVIPLIIYYALGFPTWTNDVVQQGANRPKINMFMTIGEQTIRIALVFLLIGRFQIYALVMAYIIALTLKDIVGYIVNHKVNFPLHLYLWQTFAAPMLAGVAHYFVLRYLTGLIWKNDAGTSILIYIIAITLSFPLYSFFYGLFGGWDNNTLDDFHRAVNISNFAKPITWLFWKTSALGARISPLHGKFPVKIYEEAMQEANALTQERVKILEETANGESAD
jgi:O-antigen/teichoic acid export membrane protein